MTLGVRPTAAATGYGYIQPGRADRRRAGPGACRRASSRSPTRRRPRPYRAGLSLEQRQLPVPRRCHAGRAARPRARRALGRRAALDALGRRPRLPAARRRGLRASAQDLDRLRGHGADRAGPASCRSPSPGPTSGPGPPSGRRRAATRPATRCAGLSRSSTRTTASSTARLLTTVVGLQDVVVVSTPDAVLVDSRERSDAVKELVAVLKAKGRPEADEHLRCIGPGAGTSASTSGPAFQVKRIRSSPAIACRCRSTSIAPSTGWWCAAPPR